MMSEKRFYLGNNDTTICDRSQGGSDGFNMLTIFKVVDLLNEQQATIDKVYELLKEEADIFSDEATEHDINAYIELQEFDNKDAYYLACGIKKAIKLLKGDDV